MIELKVEVVRGIRRVITWGGRIELDHFVWVLIAMVGIGRVAIARLAIVPVHGDDKAGSGMVSDSVGIKMTRV